MRVSGWACGSFKWQNKVHCRNWEALIKVGGTMGGCWRLCSKLGCTVGGCWGELWALRTLRGALWEVDKQWTKMGSWVALWALRKIMGSAGSWQ